jgi:CrcB protein
MNEIRQIFFVGLGGFCGASARYLLSGWVQRLSRQAVFPLGTFVVNMLGCLVIGWLGGLVVHRSLLGPQARLFILTGLLGGFTTFSTFSLETFNMLRDGQFTGAFANVAGQVILGLIGVFIGYKLSTLHM